MSSRDTRIFYDIPSDESAMQLTANTQFQVELASIVAEQIAMLSEHLVNPGTVTDIEDYRFRIGQIAGLNMVADLCEEVQKMMQER